MTSQASGRTAIMLHPSLPTIKETTLSWLGSELESSLFATGEGDDRNPGLSNPVLTENVQRYIDFDDQCLSMKSGEGSTSEFSGIQPFPVGSDDTPPMAMNEFNRNMQKNFKILLSESESLPKPFIESDEDDQLEEGEIDTENEPQSQRTQNGDLSQIDPLLGILNSKIMEGDIGKLIGQGDDQAIEKIQLIKLWQMMQQEELRKRQEAEIAMLNAQREKMKLDRQECQTIALEKVVSDVDFDIEKEDVETGSLEYSETIQSSDRLGSWDNCSQPKFDDVQVEGQKRSFEQILEDEMKKEEEKREKNNKAKAPIKRPFLKKGQGLSRFKGPPQRKVPKPINKDKNMPKPACQNIVSKSENKAQERKSGKNVLTKKPPVNGVVPKIQSHIVKQTQGRTKQSYPSERELQTKDRDYHIDDVDLEEFEMLERYAEDDASFFNEPSLIVSVLQQEHDVNNDREKLENRLSLRERVRERRKMREKARAKIQDDPKFSVLQVGNIHAPPPLITPEPDISSQEIMENAILSPTPPKSLYRSPERQKIKLIQRKTASLVKREKLVHPLPQPAVVAPPNQCNNFSLNNANFQLCSSPNTAFSPHSRNMVAPGSNNGKSATEDRLIQKQDSEQENEFQDDQTWGDLNDTALNTTLPTSDPADNVERCVANAFDSPRAYKVTDYMEPENEDIENPVRDTESKVSNNLLSLSPPPPPTSLMQKLFPGLKVPKSSLAKIDSKSVQHEPEKEVSDGEDVTMQEPSQASALKQKLLELESEIAKFKKENESLENLRKKQEENFKTLEKEMLEFKNQKEDELARLEEYRKTETKKLKKERKLFEEHVLATRMMPRKEEREEIQKLQEEIEVLRNDNKTKEQKWISSNNRMRNQVERLEAENKQLQQRINETEAQRLKEWNAMKSNQPKKSSVWKTVNKIVESSDIVTEAGNIDQPISSKSNLSNSHDSVLSKKPTRVEYSRPVKEGKSNKGLIAEVAFSNLKNTIEQSKSSDISAEMMHKDGKVEKTQKDGSKIVIFPNGTQKEVSGDGQTVKVRFANGDIKQIYGDGSIVYFYEENGTTHTTHRDGLQVFEFPNKQVEHHFPDGTKQITFPDQTVKYLHTDGTEQTVFPDGTEMHISTNKDKTIVFANGQREIHTIDFKKREYPDGTSKTVFSDGRQETRYASGRLRVKDAHGNVIIDRMTVSDGMH
uniref:centromere protein J-like n=1 Tax=Styela clava TaxID=7725 RepID=UPI00193A7946|nr:centromere protein J-like [Styela clava]